MEKDRDDIGIGVDSGLQLRLHTGCLLHDAKMSRFLGQEEQIMGQEEQNVGAGGAKRGAGGAKCGAGGATWGQGTKSDENSFYIPIYKISPNFAWKSKMSKTNGAGTLITSIITHTALISPQDCWYFQVEGFSGNILHMFLSNKLWGPIHALAFQTCFSCPPGMSRHVCHCGTGFFHNLK